MHHFKETEGSRIIVCKAIETYGENKKTTGKNRAGH